MDYKKIGKKLLYPHIAIMLSLIPVATAFLVCAMVFLGSEHPVSIISYVLAAYTLTVWCFKIPYLIRFFKTFKNENKYMQRWLNDERLRVNVSLFSSLIFNTVYGLFHLWLGFYHKTFWFYSLAGYYIMLALLRFFLVGYTRKNKAGEDMKTELIKYRVCGYIFLLMNLTLSVMIFFMVYWNRTFIHDEITTIAMAAYTFSAFAISTVSIIKFRKYNSPVYSASKAINLASACVSIITLEATMLTTFGEGTMDGITRKIMLALTGAAVSAFLIFMAIYMIVASTKKIKLLKDRTIENE